MSSHVAAVIVAAGEGMRFGTDRPKQFVELAGVPMLEWSIRAFEAHPAIDEVVIVLAPLVLADVPSWLHRDGRKLVAGGASRRESVSLGIASVSADAETILVHDAARPFVSAAVIDRVISAAGNGGAVPGVALKDTVKETDEEGLVLGTPDRSRLRAVQTPQGFPAAVLRRVHELAAEAGTEATDDASLCERQGMGVVVVRGDDMNFKITTMSDYRYAEWLVETGAAKTTPEDSHEPYEG